MQQTRTLVIVVLCVFALCCADDMFAANSVTDSSGRVWCVRAEVSPTPAAGKEIYLYEGDGTFGEFITMDKAIDASPHVFLTTVGKIGIVWSRENRDTGRMEICFTTYDPETGFWVHPFTVLTSPQDGVDHKEPRMEVSSSGTAHLVYISTVEDGGRPVSSLIYRMKEDGAWSEPSTVSCLDEIVAAPELYLGASGQGFPLVLVYLSSPKLSGILHSGLQSQDFAIKALQKGGIDPSPWDKLSKHRLPFNLR